VREHRRRQGQVRDALRGQAPPDPPRVEAVVQDRAGARLGAAIQHRQAAEVVQRQAEQPAVARREAEAVATGVHRGRQVAASQHGTLRLTATAAGRHDHVDGVGVGADAAVRHHRADRGLQHGQLGGARHDLADAGFQPQGGPPLRRPAGVHRHQRAAEAGRGVQQQGGVERRQPADPQGIARGRPRLLQGSGQAARPREQLPVGHCRAGIVQEGDGVRVRGRAVLQPDRREVVFVGYARCHVIGPGLQQSAIGWHSPRQRIGPPWPELDAP